MSNISSLFSRYVSLTNEIKEAQDAQKDDKKTLDEELKEEGITGARKKAFMILVKEATMTSEQEMNKKDVEAELESLRSEIN